MEEPETIDLPDEAEEKSGKKRRRRRRRRKGEDGSEGCGPGCLMLAGFLLCLTGFGLILGMPLIVAGYLAPFLGDAVQKKIRESTEMPSDDEPPTSDA